jgi:Fe-S cluster biogenesis protein NfuA
MARGDGVTSFVRAWLARVFASDATVEGDPERVRAVQCVLEELAPAVALDRGAIELVRVDEAGWVHVRMRGACASCSQQSTTLTAALEPRLRAALPWFVGLRSS